MIMNSIMKKGSISNCNSAVTAIPHLQYTSQLDFNVHSGASDTILLYTVILANRYWWPVYIASNWSILKTPITALRKKPVFGVNLYLDVTNNPSLS